MNRWIVFILANCLLLAVSAHAQQRDERARQQALTITDEANNAFKNRDFVRAEQLYAAAYAIFPSDKLQYSLGLTYERLRRSLPALLAFQRYLALSEKDRTADRTKLAQDAVERLKGSVGRVMVYGDAGLRFQVDDDPALILPHPPLFVEPGVHRVRSDKGQEQVTVTAGGLALVNLTRARGLHSSGEPNRAQSRVAVLPLLESPDGDPVAGRRLGEVIGRAAQVGEQQLVGLSELQALWSAEPELRACERAECLERLGQLVGAQSVLRPVLGVQRGPSSPGARQGRPGGDERARWRLRLEVFNVAVGESGARETAECEACSLAQAEVMAGDLVRKALLLDASRPRGIIEVNSDPPHADVYVDGRRMGFTPFKRAAFAGRHAVAVLHLGRKTVREDVMVVDGKKWVKQVRLVEGADTDAPRVLVREESLPRPTWRKATGAALLAGGSIAAAVGGAMIWLSGRCTNDVGAELASAGCDKVYGTGAAGYGLVGIGAAAVLGGIVAAALPGKRRRVEVNVGLLDSGYGVMLAGGMY